MGAKISAFDCDRADMQHILARDVRLDDITYNPFDSLIGYLRINARNLSLTAAFSFAGLNRFIVDVQGLFLIVFHCENDSVAADIDLPPEAILKFLLFRGFLDLYNYFSVSGPIHHIQQG